MRKFYKNNVELSFQTIKVDKSYGDLSWKMQTLYRKKAIKLPVHKWATKKREIKPIEMTEKYEVVKSALMVYEKKWRKENEVEK